MRVGELEQFTWGDVDEARSRWRVSQAVSKTGRARWVSLPPVLFDAVSALLPRDDRVPERRVLHGFEPTAFELRSRARAAPQAYPRSRRTIYATGGSHSSTCGANPGRASASSSVNEPRGDG